LLYSGPGLNAGKLSNWCICVQNLSPMHWWQIRPGAIDKSRAFWPPLPHLQSPYIRCKHPLKMCVVRQPPRRVSCQPRTPYGLPFRSLTCRVIDLRKDESRFPPEAAASRRSRLPCPVRSIVDSRIRLIKVLAHSKANGADYDAACTLNTNT